MEARSHVQRCRMDTGMREKTIGNPSKNCIFKEIDTSDDRSILFRDKE
jgi:hypothetical protein